MQNQSENLNPQFTEDMCANAHVSKWEFNH